MAETEQAKKLREAREVLKVNTEELAGLLGRPLPTVRAWLLPETSKAFRRMPDAAAGLLAQLVKRRKGKG